MHVLTLLALQGLGKDTVKTRAQTSGDRPSLACLRKRLKCTLAVIKFAVYFLCKAKKCAWGSRHPVHEDPAGSVPFITFGDEAEGQRDISDNSMLNEKCCWGSQHNLTF